MLGGNWAQLWENRQLSAGCCKSFHIQPEWDAFELTFQCKCGKHKIQCTFCMLARLIKLGFSETAIKIVLSDVKRLRKQVTQTFLFCPYLQCCMMNVYRVLIAFFHICYHKTLHITTVTSSLSEVSFNPICCTEYSVSILNLAYSGELVYASFWKEHWPKQTS